MLRWFSTLKFKIVALAVATGVLSAWATANLVLGTTRSDMERMLLMTQSRERATTAAILGSKLDTLLAALQAVARRTNARTWRDHEAMQKLLDGNAAAHVLFDNLLAARMDGQVIAHIVRGNSERVRAQLSIARRPYFQEALRTDQPTVSDPVKGMVTGEPLVVIAVSVPGEDGRPAGVIAGGLELRSTRLFSELGGGDKALGSRYLVMDREGNIVAHSNPARALGQASQEPGLEAVFARWHGEGSPIDTDGVAEVSNGHVVSMAGIAASNWVLVELTPEAAALRPVIAAHRTAWWSAAGVGIVAALLAGMVAWWLTLPISRLRSRAQALLESDAPAALPWPRLGGELGGLARAFRKVVDQRQRRQEQTQSLLHQLEAVFAHVEVGIALARNNRLELLSRRFCQILGYEEKELLGQDAAIVHGSAERRAAFLAHAEPALLADNVFDGEAELARRSGELFWAHIRGRAIVAGDPSKGTIWTLQDVTQARANRERLEWSSNHDSLTGLANRAAFDAMLGQATAEAGNEPFCAMFIDLDRFKQVNDTAGHAAGDALLRDIASQLVSHVRRSDTVARLGGDEFAVLLHRCPLDQARTVAENLRLAVVGYQLHWEGSSFGVGASIGMVRVDGSFTSAAEVLRAADAACYAAKQRGRNAVVLHGEG